MSRAEDDIKQVPAHWELRDVYRHLYTWHKTHGLRVMAADTRLDPGYVSSYERMLSRIPAPDTAEIADMVFIAAFYGHGIFEWSYQTEDENGIWLGAYYCYAREYCYQTYGDACHDLSRQSSLLTITEEYQGQVLDEVAQSLGYQ